MRDHSTLRLLRSLALPLVVAGIVPFLLVARFRPFGIRAALPWPYLQIPLGLALFGVGLALLVNTIRLFSQIGRGTLAPWDPPRHLVVQGVYRYVRNPMISGVLFMLLGETVVLGSPALLYWFLVAFVVNTVYFKLSEEPGLVKRFGQEYITYRANVPMWVPRLKQWEPRLPGQPKAK